ncbi:DUF2628 domain-containing protein [Enterobacteriaceae bacterium 4M9]|nr:DUF2628 domain-containing protein [Enterobacteriaceae bacterium 4M9]
MDTSHSKQYSAKWQERFAFFDKNGSPGTPQYKAELKALPFGKRVLINSNIIAFFFGFIYFFVLGLWRKNLVLVAIAIGVALVLGIIEGMMGAPLPRGVDMGVNIALGLMWSTTANYAYYLKEVKGLNGWNPFEGIGKS